MSDAISMSDAIPIPYNIILTPIPPAKNTHPSMIRNLVVLIFFESWAKRNIIPNISIEDKSNQAVNSTNA